MKRIRKMWEVMTAKIARIKITSKKATVVKRLLKVKIKTKILERVMGRLIIAQKKKKKRKSKK